MPDYSGGLTVVEEAVLHDSARLEDLVRRYAEFRGLDSWGRHNLASAYGDDLLELIEQVDSAAGKD